MYIQAQAIIDGEHDTTEQEISPTIGVNRMITGAKLYLYGRELQGTSHLYYVNKEIRPGACNLDLRHDSPESTKILADLDTSTRYGRIVGPRWKVRRRVD